MTDHTDLPARLEASPGALLAAARAALGLSVADVASRMKLAPRQVEAIEADRFDDLPGPVFVRGFVRNYARLLDLDPEPLLTVIDPHLANAAPLRAHEISGQLPAASGPGRKRRRMAHHAALALIATALLLGIGYELRRSYLEGAADAQPAAEPPSPPEKLAAIPAMVGPAAGLAETVLDAPPAAIQSEPEPAAAPRPPPSNRVPSVPVTIELKLQFDRDSWVEIKRGDGEIVHTGTERAGSERAFAVTPPASLVIGNASAVRMTYNGRPVDVAAHATRNIARISLE